MIIGEIKDGIVLDHITAGKGMEIYNVLHLGQLDCTVALIKNAESPKLGKKDIIKISTLLDLDLDVLGYLDPGITVNVIRNSVVAERFSSNYHYIVYTAETTQGEFTYMAGIFKNDKGFWMVQICTPSSNYNEQTFFTYMDSVNIG